MSDAPLSTSRRLDWRFWLLLFAPALVSLGGTWLVHRTGGDLVDLFDLNVALALPLNFFCAIWCARQVVLRHDARGGSSPWMFLWGPLFFFLNVALVFGGCVALTGNR